MSFDAPYNDEAAKLVKSLQNIIAAVKEHGSGTTLVMTVLAELMTWAGEVTHFQNLPADEKKKFFAEVFDEAIGTEDHALLKQIGFLSGDVLEQASDAMKGIFVAFLEHKGIA